MRRRDFLGATLAVSGISLAGISARDALAQIGNFPPIATGAARTSRGLMTVRAYAGRSEGQFLLLTRINGRDTWRVCDLAEMLGRQFRAAAREPRLDGTLVLPGNQLLQFEIQDLRAPTRKSFVLNFNGANLRGEVTNEPPEGEPPSTSSPITFLGAVVAIVAIFGLVALAGIISGNGIVFTLRFRGLEITVSVGGEQNPPSAPVVHDPVCDTMPPMNC